MLRADKRAFSSLAGLVWRVFVMLGILAHPTVVKSANWTPNGWEIREGLIPPQCFVTEWLSGDNFEEFADKYSIENVKAFRSHPGLYLGKEIPNLNSMIPSWRGDPIILATPVDLCFKGVTVGGTIGKAIRTNIVTKGDMKESTVCRSNTNCMRYAYKLLSHIPMNECGEFAPHIKGHCESAVLIKVGNYSGGSKGWDFQYNIYGLFKTEEAKRFILPLKIFYKEDKAVNFVVKLMQ